MISYNLVKIIKCEGKQKWNSWYKDKIGREYEVGKLKVLNGISVYQVANCSEHTHGLILKEDCKFIKALRDD